MPKLLETHIIPDKGKLCHAFRTVSLLSNDDLGLVVAALLIVHRFPIDEENIVGLLLDPPGFPQVRQNGPPVPPGIAGPVQLGKTDHRYFKFLGKILEVGGHLSNSLIPGIGPSAGPDLLEIIYHDQLNAPFLDKTPGSGLYVVGCEPWAVIDPDRKAKNSIPTGARPEA